jgi:hypothetical protein
MDEFNYRIPIRIHDPLGNGRKNDSIRINLTFDYYKPFRNSVRVVNDRNFEIPSQIINVVRDGDRISNCSIVFMVELRKSSTLYSIYFDTVDRGSTNYNGIASLKTTQDDGFRRLDTGKYIIELCHGTGDGSGGSKWGIRYFEEKQQGINLIHNCFNAIGGVYGPFFTPENGLINPPAHMVINIEPVDEGPVVCRYKFYGQIPNGINPDLKNKNLEIWWTFYYNSPWFERTYILDDYETVIDKKPVKNRITVGDEIESGKDNLHLSTYKHYGGTAYRSGDLYANILLKMVKSLIEKNPDGMKKTYNKLGIDMHEDPSSWHWDKFWRLFCVIEKALPETTLREELSKIVESANEIVWNNQEHTIIHYTNDYIKVNAEPDQTIFPLNAQKTCAYSPATDYSFIHYVNTVIPRMQIVQRKSSGWVNWGTNGENEYPELLSGSTIWSAYGRFCNWEEEVDKVEMPLAYSIGSIEKRN